MDRALVLLLCCLSLQQSGTALVRSPDDDVPVYSHARRRRNLLLDGTTVKLLFGFGLPFLVQEQSLTIGVLTKFLYDLPTNYTDYTDPYTPFRKRSATANTRWHVYSKLEAVLHRLELDGRACVLRAICEAADTTLRHNGLVGEILHVLLTPSTTSEEHRNYMDGEYHAAERLGANTSGCCHVLYSECKVGLLDVISKIGQ